MSARIFLVLVVALLGSAAARAYGQGAPGAQATQGAAATVRVRPQFQGATQVRVDAQADSVRVDIRLWSIAGGQRIAALELPFRGLTVVELRGGRVTTIIDGRRVERRVGEIWSVPTGSTMQLETGDDMATLQTTVIGG
jgi:hypothetical protein